MRDAVKGGALTEVTFYILLALYEPRHGYAVMRFVEAETGGRLTLGAGTLYGALSALEERGWISPHGDGGGRKREYIVTAEGKKAAARELQRLRALTASAERIMEGHYEKDN